MKQAVQEQKGLSLPHPEAPASQISPQQQLVLEAPTQFHPVSISVFRQPAVDGWWPGGRPKLINFQVEKMEEGQDDPAAEGGKGGQELAFPPTPNPQEAGCSPPPCCHARGLPLQGQAHKGCLGV